MIASLVQRGLLFTSTVYFRTCIASCVWKHVSLSVVRFLFSRSLLRETLSFARSFLLVPLYVVCLPAAPGAVVFEDYASAPAICSSSVSWSLYPFVVLSPASRLRHVFTAPLLHLFQLGCSVFRRPFNTSKSRL
jgi:hypothetical protein